VGMKQLSDCELNRMTEGRIAATPKVPRNVTTHYLSASLPQPCLRKRA
jgi:hypothetical protein